MIIIFSKYEQGTNDHTQGFQQGLRHRPHFLWHNQTSKFFQVKLTLLVWVREAVNLATLRHLGYEESDYNKGSLYDRRPIEISKIWKKNPNFS